VLRGHAFHALDRTDDTEHEFVAALDGLAPDEVEQRIYILAALGETYLYRMHRSGGRRYATEALALAEQIGRAHLTAQALAVLGHSDTSDGDLLTGQEKFRHAFAQADTSQIGPMMQAHDQYGLNLYCMGQFAEAAEHLQHVLHYA
jgi:hypothetical protein